MRTGEYPQLQRYVDEIGIDALWQAFEDHSAEAGASSATSAASSEASSWTSPVSSSG